MKIQIRNAIRIAEISLDMSEDVEENYRQHGDQLEVFPYRCRISNWNDTQRKARTAQLNKIIDDLGCVWEAITEGHVVGIASLKALRLTRRRVQLYSLHVDKNWRRFGIGRMLFDVAVAEAKVRGASGLYISSSPKRGTVEFYQRMGACLTDCPEESLVAAEPNDIHLDLMWNGPNRHAGGDV